MATGMLVRGRAGALLAALASRACAAQSPAEFYKGKTVDLYIGYSVGGGYDLYARMIARHLGKHIPGQSDGGAEEHGGRRQPAADQLALQRRPQGRHRDRRQQPRRGVRSAARPEGRAIRRHQVHLDRQRQQRGQRLRRLGEQRHQQVRRTCWRSRWRSARPASATTPISFPRCSTACSAPSSRS